MLTFDNKPRSAMNAFRHALTGQIMVMPAEDLEAYNQFQNSFHDFYQPQNAVEVQCVQFIVDSSWKINRSSAWLNQILVQQSLRHDSDTGGRENNGQVNTAFAIAAVVAGCTRDLANFSIFEQRQYRLFERAQDRLHMLQESRREKERNDLEEAAALMRLHERQQEELAAHAAASEAEQPPYVPLPYSPTEDGFVFSFGAIKAYNNRLDRVLQARNLPQAWRAAG